jgi:coenzyme F420-reducing hydrogenase beta subunit
MPHNSDGQEMLAEKSICTGCSACYAACPTGSISMLADVEGFLYPKIDENKCIKCSRCETVCMAIMQGDERTPLQAYAAKNTNEAIRNASSSGGIFTALAEQIIQRGGVVFGARFNDSWEVVHDYTESLEGLAKFRGSKYVQSNICNTYKQARDFLETGRRVLFSGTPCQISGLKGFLQKEYNNLLTVDLICSGVSSPAIWKKHIKNYEKKGAIININFRAKYPPPPQCVYGNWKAFMFSITFDGKKTIYKKQLGLEHGDAFQQGFINTLFARPSCHRCPIKSFKSGSDITLGDFWGIEKVAPDFADDNGVSVVLLNSKKGKEIYSTLGKKDIEVNYNDIKPLNSMMNESSKSNKNRDVFFQLVCSGADVDRIILKFTKPPLSIRIKTRLRYVCVIIVRQIGIYSFVKSLIRRKRT